LPRWDKRPKFGPSIAGRRKSCAGETNHLI
jgi:hypothetical protein